ncbi:TVP38/TMEM64 family protein [Clostridium saccharobutylicum]|uniref:TVP38/TMEM64 family membrane protein n=1 Tax=Clostridium saccharobutylicum DSM 13864 TaxID=1345695 RepID=U5MQ36_CLOSA|nr:VTT domain-containing protein [Clostridium saccharobutylicum]AGX42633.1 SNARE associated golgi family protein [Clostridium saccharobutylicum DSM 13864]AQR89920.1 SNARE associated golgi protein [Clostridium saccharobutylicum]AQR99825.1 SNARE associated golgi protein [Clostridium saccharobutylicum]AQS09553.1 SNARE associated golgi protein [Clostridium saccharobutylicum]AQS13809.1 SNARE associated golgi protein [Clostridium saccharobutylicum]
MNNLFKVIVFLFWMAIIAVFFKYQLYIDGVGKITGFLESYPKYSALLFLIIASFRIFTFVPCTVFIIVSGILFDPVKAFILVTIANLLSEILLFLFVKVTIGMGYQENIINKYPKIYSLIQNNSVKILALGVSSPVVPSDVVCFFSALTGMSFSKYALTIFIADTPVILLYTFLGISTKYSVYVFIATLIIIILVSYINYRRWNSKINLNKDVEGR